MLNGPRSSREKVGAHRERLRAQGLRPKAWLGDRIGKLNDGDIARLNRALTVVVGLLR